MDRPGQLRGERVIDHPMALDPGLAREGIGDDMNGEMSFARHFGVMLAHCVVAGVAGRVVFNPQFEGRERLAQSFVDGIFNAHETVLIR